MNGVNLNQFQFEFDLTWMAFFQDEAGRTYARYGGRDDVDSETFLTKASLIRTMQQVLDLHADGNVQVAGKYEPMASSVSTPSDIAPMRPMIAKRDESCIHCHDVKVATLRHKRAIGKLDKEMVFTYPSPSNLGIQIDPDRQNIVAHVDSDSAASSGGLVVGDQLASSNGQRILTYADFTRVLELAPETGKLPVTVVRNGRSHELSIDLPRGWRTGRSRNDFDPSWRPSLETVGPGGGFWGVPLPSDSNKRRNLNLTNDDLAIRVTFIWGDHAKRIGLKLNDVVISVDGQSSDMSMRQFHAYLHLNRNWGEKVPLVIVRDGKKLNLTMQLPRKPAA